MAGVIQDSADARSKTIVKNFRCRAWVNLDGTGDFSSNPSTSVIRASGNVSSIEGLATGKYAVNFTTAMPDANYAVVIDANINSSNTDTRRGSRITHYYAGSCKFVTGTTHADVPEDFEFVSVAVFR